MEGSCPFFSREKFYDIKIGDNNLAREWIKLPTKRNLNRARNGGMRRVLYFERNFAKGMRIGNDVRTVGGPCLVAR